MYFICDEPDLCDLEIIEAMCDTVVRTLGYLNLKSLASNMQTDEQELCNLGENGNLCCYPEGNDSSFFVGMLYTMMSSGYTSKQVRNRISG